MPLLRPLVKPFATFALTAATVVWVAHTAPQYAALAKANAALGEGSEERLEAEVRQLDRSGIVPPGAIRAAMLQKAAIQAQATTVPGSAGAWSEYGVGNLDDGAGVLQSARVDQFAYDATHKRLFAAVGSGGVWMSESATGKVNGLAENWVSVGDKLPTQINGAVAFSPDADGNGTADPTTPGTLITVGGEAVMGSSGYLGMGAFYTTNLGASWQQATGVPDDALAFKAAVDPAYPNIVYAATSKGLFRSTNAGRSYVNVALPTSSTCKGVEVLGPCQFANYVTDVVVKMPGGSTNEVCAASGCSVVASVGFRTGSGAKFQDGTTIQAPGNGIYRSPTGVAGSFARVDVAAANNSLPNGFTPQVRIGHIELGAATGADQNHNYLYAVVQDAALFNGAYPVDAPLDIPMVGTSVEPFATVLNGIFVSADFGTTWLRMADTGEIASNVSTGTGMLVFATASSNGPGNQSWYDLWVLPDPTRQSGGVPTRMSFGLEEIWESRITTAVPLDGRGQQGNNDFEVIGAYNSTGANVAAGGTTTHPDQHAAIYLPTEDGGVCLIAGNDGGIFKQCKASGAEFDNASWGAGANKGIYALLPYGLGVAKDGTVWFGLQDNGSGLIDPRLGKKLFEKNGGDGFYAEVDPNDSNVAYYETQNGGLRRTINRGVASTAIAPTYTRVMFDNWFRMDPLNAQHMITAAQQIYETLAAKTVTASSWVQVFSLGTNPATNAIRTTTAMEILGSAIYIGGCGDCGASGNDTGFKNVLATNVGIAATPPVSGTNAGWHFATASGLPNRYITSFAIDPTDPKIVYATLAGYLSNLRPAGSFLDPNQNAGTGNIFKSVDAGQSFVNISGNLPSVEANSVIIRGNQLLLGTDIGPFISNDSNGSQWAVLGAALPNVPVNMLRLQPKTTATDPDTLFAATTGRGIWSYSFVDPAPVNNPPIARLGVTPDNGEAPLTVSFSAVNSVDPDSGDAVVSYSFNPGDGTASTTDTASATLSHVYSNPGTYTVQLLVKDRAGLASTSPATATVVVRAATPPPPPVGTIAPTPVIGTVNTQTHRQEGRFGGGSTGLLLLAPLALAALRRRRVKAEQ